MRFKVDENLPVEVAELLRARGHDALTVLDEKLGGRDDRTIGDIVREEKRALITLDLDFADIRTFPPGQHAGLIVLRPVVQDKRSLLALIERVIPLLNTEPLVGYLWVVDQTALRIRGEAV
jgi:predicted nuclease of predicted toxin-antitoxin system